MQNYYDILGITPNASTEQIKAAFRRLAKLYHPDKNPNGKEEFGNILKAYEVLVDVSRRRHYDIKLKHNSGHNFTSKKTSSSKQKEWAFSDEEIKRRQYYKEHYKKEYERYAKNTAVTKSNYNEYKYILFAAPLAVGLFMFIINIYEQSSAEESKNNIAVTAEKRDELKMTDNPFAAYFKNPVFDSVAKRSLTVKNFSTKDIAVIIFDIENKFLRCGVIKTGFYIELEQLPNSEMNLRFMSGKNWNKQKERKGLSVIGGFEEDETFCVLNTKQTNGYTVTIDDSALNNLDKISEKDFFKRD